MLQHTAHDGKFMVLVVESVGSRFCKVLPMCRISAIADHYDVCQRILGCDHTQYFHAITVAEVDVQQDDIGRFTPDGGDGSRCAVERVLCW